MNTLTISITEFKASPAKALKRASKGDMVFLKNNRRPTETFRLVPVKTVYVPAEEPEVIVDDFTREAFEVFKPSIKNHAS